MEITYSNTNQKYPRDTTTNSGTGKERTPPKIEVNLETNGTTTRRRRRK
jgi:hypothetical protein